MSRRGTNTILMKRCDSPLIVGQQMETRPSSEYGDTGGERDARKNSQKMRKYEQAGGGKWASPSQSPAFQEVLCVFI